MKKLLSLLLVLHSLSPLGAQQPPRRGQSYQVTRVDLNGDGKPEKVGLVCTEVKESGWYSRLSVWDSGGRRIWQSMPAKVGVWSFGCWDWGMSDLPWVGDLDGDSRIEALSPEPVSDVSPVSFRVYRWSGKAFHHLRTASLIAENERQFNWSSKAEGASWLGNFRPGGIGVIWITTTDGGARVREGRVQPQGQGFRVVEWLK